MKATTATEGALGLLAELARERVGDGSLLLFEDQHWTGTQLAARASRLSAGLRDAGLRPGERVVVCMANCPEVGISYNAIWRAGAVVTPVLFLLGEPELRHVLVDSGARFVITTPDFLPKVLGAATGVPTVAAVIVAGVSDPATGAAGDGAAAPTVLDFTELEAGDEAGLVDTSPTEMAALLYTGGTTGRSKGVMLTHQALSAAARAAHLTQQSVPAEGRRRVGLSPLPLSHVYGLTVSVIGVHATQPATSVLMRWFDPVGLLTLVERHGVQTVTLVPSMIRMLLEAPVEEYDTSSLNKVYSGSAPLPRETALEWARRLPHSVLAEGYGCTEAAAIVTAHPGLTTRPGSVGLPSAGVELRIERPDGSAAAAAEDGEICIRGPMLMTGYWNAPEDTAWALRGGWLHTGDIGRLDKDGYLYVVDRIKNVIIRNGFNIYPRDVEDVLLAHPAVAACGVVGRPDPKVGEEVVAFVQLAPGAAATPEELVAYARERLSAVKYPREIRIIDAIPLTSVLKTDHKALRRSITG
ncbi:AMP-binding protein [Frankia sp. CNm7]|uniref:AMP-binding protein n=1 Tax=Frankia nepalensis TaxID=1836974 RepID=A0A937RRT7_9ACTN|nr:AMP-binding protein [Frankia nepalensis]MBL7499573.1 AMP-binding protein [Frankia nepalensis]MBL7513062.1 AMP-binding protein [Frankia nepalensis]MBL7522898.1 AMP-binding protein [Frankia nepalensis]MBL7633775.1 AMP-binding protein [Frankia nepalensis]